MFIMLKVICFYSYRLCRDNMANKIFAVNRNWVIWLYYFSLIKDSLYL